MKLRILSGPRRGEEIELPVEGKLTIGRDAGCDLTIGDAKISREHCALVREHGRWLLCDGGSANGTWVDGERVSVRVLATGDTVTLGDTAFEVELPRAIAGGAGGLDAVEEVDSLDGADSPSRRRAAVPIVAVALAVAIALLALFVFDGATPDAGDAGGERAGSVSSAPSASAGRDAAPASDPGAASTPGAASSSTVVTNADERDFANAFDSGPARDAGPGAPTVAAGARPARTSGLRERVRKLVDATLPALIADGEYKRALSLIAYHAEWTTGFDPAPEREKVLAAARVFLDETLATLRTLSDANRADDARELVFDRLGVLPRQFADELNVALDEFVTREERELGVARQQERYELDVSARILGAVAAYDFEAALRVIAEARTASGVVAVDAAALATLTKLEGRVRAAASVWSAAVTSLESRAGGSARVALEFRPGREVVVLRESGGFGVDPEPARGQHRIVAIDRGFVVARRESDDWKSTVFFDVVALADDWILSRARRAWKDSDDSARVEGLTLLRLLREGPDAVASLLERSELDAARRDELARLALERRDFWLVERRKMLRARREFIATDVRASAGDWLRLGAQVAEQARLWRRREDWAFHSRDLVNVFREARIEQLRRDPPKSAFRAAEAAFADGRLRLVYDFRDDAQLLDLHPVGRASTVARSSNELVLRGECRFFLGNPFVGDLSVDVRLPAGGYEAERPNVAIALWTFEGYPVRAQRPMSLTKSFDRTVTPDSDYFVFGYGYDAAVADFGGTPIHRVRPAGATEDVELPAHVVFLGRHGRSLHELAGECVWADPFAKRVTGALALSVDAGLRGARFVAGKRELFDATPPLLAELVQQRERVGSVSVLAAGGELRVASIEIEGSLDRLWLRDVFQGAIDGELRRIFE